MPQHPSPAFMHVCSDGAEAVHHRAVERVAGREADAVQVCDDDAVRLDQAGLGVGHARVRSAP